MRILAIIVTYNASKWIDACFGSLEQSSLPIDVAVIDNNSSDNTVSIIKHKFPKVDIYETGKNLGFGKANNLGLKLALSKNYDYVILLNQDAWIQKTTIEILINEHLHNLDFGVIVPLQMNGAGDLIDSLFLEFTIANNRHLISNVFKGIEGLHQVEFANAACWLMPISTVKTIGGFDPIFPHYGEDDDYLNRLKKRGLKVGLNASTKVYHDRERRAPKTSLDAVVNESYTRELIELKNPFIRLKSRAQIIKNILISGFKFLTSAFNRYYIYKIIAYFKIFMVYETIKEHRENERISSKHYI